MKKVYILLIIQALSFQTIAASSLTPVDLTCEYLHNPMGIDISNPRLCWKSTADGTIRGASQTAWQVQVSEGSSFNTANLVWDSKKVAGEQSLHIVYNGNALKPKTSYQWRVRVWDEKGNPSKWSQPAFWETGLMSPDGWEAKWIAAGEGADKDSSIPCPYVRSEFTLAKKVRRARAYITSLGLYEGYINGQRIGDQVLTPGWTSYENRLQYQTFDVTGNLLKGSNAIGITLGDGWYRGQVARARRPSDTRLFLLFQLEVEFSDGTKQFIVSDGNWKESTGPLRMSDIYDGETYDARLEMDGWASPGFDDKAWKPVSVADLSKKALVGANSVPIQRIEELKPVDIFTTPAGDLVVDMGQNMVGWIKLTVSGNAGIKVVLHHAEVLDKEGNFYTENLRKADQKIEYQLKGEGIEVYEPHFTFQGFRYVKVNGFPGDLKPENVTGIVVHSKMEKTGAFECSSPIINQLQKNIQWGQKGNFVDVPTDCPQRDERLGWTGDAQAFSNTAIYNYNVGAFFTKWLADLAADQKPNGAVPHVIPDVLQRTSHGSTGWADAATIIPWAIYERYGDERILESQYESMKKWVEYLRELADADLIVRSGFHFGDWLFFISPTHWNVKPGHTDIDLIATAFFAYSSRIVSNTAKVLGKTADAKEFDDLNHRICASFQREFVTPNHRLSPNSQTAYVLALYFDLLEEESRNRAVKYLVDNITQRDYHLSTGFLGTPYLCHVLSQNGYTDVAYRLLLQESYPSWLYPVTMGATTIWERWDGIKPDSTFQTPRMNSFNHYAYGAIGDWMYSTITGIKPVAEKPGYKHIMIAPEPSDSLDYARAEYDCLYGTIKSGWEKADDGHYRYSITVPPNTTASVVLKVKDVDRVMESGKAISTVLPGVMDVKRSDGHLFIEIGSGSYVFTD